MSSVFKRLLGKSSSSSGTQNANEQIHKLQDQIENLNKRDAVLEKRVEVQTAAAKKAALEKNQAVALQHMKQRKALQEQQDRTAANRANLEHLQDALEETIMNVTAVQAQTEAAAALQRLHSSMGGEDKILASIEKARDVVADADSLSRQLAEPLLMGDDDDDELQRQLEDLLNPTPDPSPMLLSIPKHTPIAAATEDDQESANKKKLKEAEEDEQLLEQLNGMLA